MFLLIVFIPMIFGIINYFDNVKKYFIVLSAFITEFTVIIFSLYGKIIPGGWDSLKGIELNFGEKEKIIIFLVTVVFFINYLRIKDKYDNTFYFLYLILLGTTNGFFMSRDFFNIYVHLELITIILFILSAYDKEEKKLFNALTYLLYSSVAFGFYMIAVAVQYSYSGSLNFDINTGKGFHELFFPFMIIFVLIKSGFILVTNWLPRVHSDSVKGLSPILSGIFAMIPIYILSNFSVYMDEKMKNILIPVLITISVFTYFINSLQKDAKKILAYSTMGQNVFGLIICMIKPEYFWIFYIIHMVSKSILFFGAENIKEKYTLSIDFIILSVILFINLSGIYPSQIYGIKKGLEMTNIININYFFAGIITLNYIKNIKIEKILSLKSILYTIIFGIFYVFLNRYLSKPFSDKNILIPYIIYFSGIISGIPVQKIIKNDFKKISFENTIIISMLVLLLLLIV